MASMSSLPSICISSSSHLIGRKVPVIMPPLPLRRIRFNPLRISAVHATAERFRSPSHIASPQSKSSLYDVLGIDMNATCQDIKVAYRRLARVSHPDVASNGADEFIKIHAAYATLSDPEKRSDYDRTLFRQLRPVSYPIGMSQSSTVMSGSPDLGFSGYTRRKWETDQCW